MQRISLWLLGGLVAIALWTPGVEAQHRHHFYQRPWHQHQTRPHHSWYHPGESQHSAWHHYGARQRPHAWMHQERWERQPHQEHFGQDRRTGGQHLASPERGSRSPRGQGGWTRDGNRHQR